MPWKNHNGDISDLRPSRVRLANSETRTAEEVTDEVLAEAGWYWEEPVVIVEPEVVITDQPILGVIEEPIELNTTPVFTFDSITGNITA